MAVTILRDASVVVNGVNLSDHCTEVTIESAKDEVEITAMGATNKSYLVGLGDATITCTFLQDFAAASVDATLWPLHAANSTFTVVVKPTSAAVSATNPSYTMTAILPNFNPLAGAIGEASSTEVNFRNASQTGLVKAIA